MNFTPEEELTSVLLKIFQNIEKKGILQHLFSKINITLAHYCTGILRHNILKRYLFIYVKGKIKEREIVFILWFIPNVVVNTKTWAGLKSGARNMIQLSPLNT